MTQKDLFKYQDCKKLYTEAKERLAEFEETIFNPPSPTMDGMPKTHDDSNPERLSETIDRRDELIANCNACLIEYIRAGRILDKAEEVLSPIEVTIVEKRYRLGIKDWESIADSIGYSVRRAFGYHKEALKKIANL